METNTKYKLGLVTMAMLGLVACGGGSAPMGSTDLASRAPSTSDTTKAWVECNVGSSNGGQFEVRLAAVTENGNLRNDLMWFRLGNVPSDFSTSNNHFQLFRWQANTAGSTYLDPIPLQFEIYHPNGALILAARSSIRWSDVQTAASQMSISDPSQFFRTVLIKVNLRDPTAQFDALMTVLYTSAGPERDRSNLLLPVFDANPEHYKTDTDGQPRNMALVNLHPFLNTIGQGWTTADYKARALTLCSSF